MYCSSKDSNIHQQPSFRYIICYDFQTNKDEIGARVEDPGLKMEFLYAVHDALRSMVMQ